MQRQRTKLKRKEKQTKRQSDKARARFTGQGNTLLSLLFIINITYYEDTEY